jgi:hypothetical protein
LQSTELQGNKKKKKESFNINWKKFNPKIRKINKKKEGLIHKKEKFNPN